jgi:hypothetical protein
MEDLLTQRINYAEIIPYRNYCRLDEKKSDNLGVFNNSLDSLDDDVFESVISKVTRIINGGGNKFEHILDKKKVGRVAALPEKKGKRKVNFFVSSLDGLEERIELNYAGKLGCTSFFTTKNRHIVNHFANPFSEIMINTFERSIRLHGEKLTVKIYQQIKGRRFNNIYFKKSFYVYSITFNLRTGNFTTLIMQKSAKISSKQFRTNCFFSLHSILSKDNGIISNHNTYDKMIDHETKAEILQTLDNKIFCQKLNEVLDLGSPNPESWSKNNDDLIKRIIDKFVAIKQIKVPNDYQKLLISSYPTEKFLKKNDRKLVASVLDLFKIKSKITIKILHLNPNIRIDLLANLCYLFGKDFSKYVANIVDEFFIDSKHNKVRNLHGPVSKIKPSTQFGYGVFNLFDSEKENLVKLLNSRPEDDINDTIDLIHDHFNMIKKVREYIPDTSLKAKNWNDFRSEHSELTKIIGSIKKGWVIEYQFNPKMVKEIEETIVSRMSEDSFYLVEHYPHILKREEEYIEEGSHMHHCVATYADKNKSIIISLRNKNGTDRVTSEYDTQTGACLQSRYYCNARPPEEYKNALEILSERVETFARLGLLHSTDMKKVPVMINGVEVTKLPIHTAGGGIFHINADMRHPLPF